ncbi:MAG: MAPEG family protein [Panacagrimonas sp.]
MIVTPLYAGLLAFWFFLLSLRVISRRRGNNINLGDGGDAEMHRRVRGHGNFAEYVPFALLLMALLEIGGVTPIWLLHLLGLTLLAARLLHGIALSYTQHFMLGRVLGTVLTFVVLLVAGLLCAWHGIASLIVA